MTDELQIVEAQIPDIKELIFMCREMVPASTFNHVGFDMRHFGEYCFKLIESDNAVIFIAKQGDETTGAILCSVWPGVTSPALNAVEHGMYVRPERRSLKTARRLLAAYVEWATANGAKRITAGNSAGAPDEGYQKLLTRCGFEKAGSLMYQNI